MYDAHLITASLLLSGSMSNILWSAASVKIISQQYGLRRLLARKTNIIELELLSEFDEFDTELNRTNYN